MNSNVEVVVTNYKRPTNMAKILPAFKQQTVPCRLTLVDCHPCEEFSLPQEAVALSDQYLRLNKNHGPWNRFAPGFFCETEFVYFHDDDMLPGRKVIEHFLRWTESKPDFGVLGQFGRNLAPSRRSYQAKEIPRLEQLRPVDVIIRGYWVRARHLHHVLRLKWALASTRMIEDDLLLAASLALYAGRQHYLTPQSQDLEERINREELPSPHAQCPRADHYQVRNELVARLRQIGWRGSVDP